MMKYKSFNIILSLIKFKYLLLVLFIYLSNNVAAQFNEYSLFGLIHKSFNYHPSMSHNANLQAAAKQGVQIAKWQYFPTIQVSNNLIHSSTDVNYIEDSNVTIVTLSQPLWSGGRIYANLNKSRAELQIQKSNALIAKQDLAINIISIYTKWYSNYLQKEALLKSKNAYTLLQEQIKRRIEQGATAKNDLMLINSRLLQVEVSLNSIINLQQGYLLQLQEMTGEELNTEDLIANISADYVINNNQELLLDKVMSIDPKLKQLSAQLDLYVALYKENSAKLSPQLSLKLERQWGSFNVLDDSIKDRISINLAHNFGAGLSSINQIKQANLRLKAAFFELESEKNILKQKFTNDLLYYESLIKQKELLDNSLNESQKIQQSLYRQFIAGKKQWQDIMVAINTTHQLYLQLSNIIAESILFSWRLAISINGVNKI